MAQLFLLFFIFLVSCSELGNEPFDKKSSGNVGNSSSSFKEESSSSSLSSSSSSIISCSSNFVLIESRQICISKNVLSTESVTWYEAVDMALALGARLPTNDEWEAAVAEGNIEQYEVFEEWTNTCVDNCDINVIRKSFSKPLEDYTTNPNGYPSISITFRIVRNGE